MSKKNPRQRTDWKSAKQIGQPSKEPVEKEQQGGAKTLKSGKIRALTKTPETSSRQGA
jgi:hypothetical protein